METSMIIVKFSKRFTSIAAVLTAGTMAILSMSDATHAAEISVFSDGPVAPILTGLAETFGRETGHQAHITGAPTPVLKQRLGAGEPVDVFISGAHDVAALVEEGRFVNGSTVVIARVGIGLAMREGARLPDISSPSALKKAVLDADSVIVSTFTTGDHFLAVLARLGVDEEMKARTTRVSSGAAIFQELLKRQGNDLGVASMTQVLEQTKNGIRPAGPLPADLQHYIEFAASVTTSSRSPDLAREFIRFLASPNSKAAFAAGGAE
jgi:molybdate transport system substrate-binding protein